MPRQTRKHDGAAVPLRWKGYDEPRGLGSAAAVDEETRPYPFARERGTSRSGDARAQWAVASTERPRLTGVDAAEVQAPAPALARFHEVRDELTPARSTVRRAAFSLIAAGTSGEASQHWYVRLRLRQQHLAELWAHNLTPRDVLVWQPATGYWTPLLDVPELRDAVHAASDGDLRELGDSIVRKPAPLSQRPPPPSARSRGAAPPGYSSIPPAVVHTPLPTIPRPPRPASVQLEPPAAAAPAPARSAPPPRPSTPPAKPRRAAWIDGRAEHLTWLAAGLLAGMAIAIGAGRLGTRDRAEPAAAVSSSAAQAASMAAAVPAPGTSAGPGAASARESTPVLAASALPVVAAPARTPTASRKPAKDARSESSNAVGSGAFDRRAARSALTSAALRAWHCGAGEALGSVVMTFSPSGSAQNVSVNGLEGDVRKACVVNAFRSTRIKPFQGGPVTVQKSFRLP